MAKKKFQWNSDKLLGISAMSISFITLVIFIYQTNLMSKQNYLSILPYLSISTSDNSANNTFAISLDNYGVGPAIIESTILSYQGKNEDLIDYDNEFLKYLKAKAPILDSITAISYSTLDKGLAIPAGTKYNILTVFSEKDYKLYKTTLKELVDKGLYFEINYKSIQDEHWKINNLTKGPEKLD
ncbi:hypothetical protein [Pontimicrobium aquaticum]|uniref:Uncharacterized protein n=1 Tax=Pontimicrobium aquaticum TaxID=2565367 RepID=A0A4U0EVA6_9FLAO|nr:hypothetical protein [Pontimicrobium aquaticum]TJY35831.1 hypothetical protein E5167_08140 [Pontimicrobium aquaticum]